jgi:hypothetical protein
MNAVKKGWCFEVFRRTKKGAKMFLRVAEVEASDNVTEEQARLEFEQNLNDMHPGVKHVVESQGETEIIDFSEF